MNELVVSLTLFLLSPAMAAVDGQEPRSHYEIATYTSRTECDIAARTVRIHARGARVMCLTRELTPDEKVARLEARR